MIKILLIDDINESSGIVMYENIEYCIEQFDSPLHAFNYIIKNLPDGIIINMNNREIDSAMVYERIRKMPAGKNIPIFLSGDNEESYSELIKDGITRRIKEDTVNKEMLKKITKILEVTPQESNKVILLVDDSPIVLDTVKMFLEAHYQVDAMVSARAAIEYLETKVPDLILLDIGMPEMDGIELMKKIKEIPSCAKVPVLFQTGLATMEKVKECMELGAAGYIVKPVNKMDLLNRIAAALKKMRKKETIMLIDNYAPSAANLDTLLNQEYNIIGEGASVVALSDLQEKEVDYIFINMDNASVYLEKVREKARRKKLPIILISTDIKSENVKKEMYGECKYALNTPLEAYEIYDVLLRVAK